MIRLATIEWRLGQAASGICHKYAAASGMILDHINAYPRTARSAVRAALGLGDLPQVADVIPASPAERAGVRAGDSVLAIAGVAADTDTRSPLAAEALAMRIAALPVGQPTTITVERAGETLNLALVPERACAARLVLKVDSRIRAFSDHHNAAITTGLVRFAQNDDEIALVAGHELAHIIRQDRSRGALASRRAAEDAADALGAQIAHCAGYDAGRALDFWRRFARRDALGWLRSPSHPSSGARRRSLEELTGHLACPLGTEPEGQPGQ